MEQNKNCRRGCHERCAYRENSFYENIALSCEFAEEIGRVCGECGNHDNCVFDMNEKCGCTENRKDLLDEIKNKTDEQIIEYLRYTPHGKCTFERTDVMALARDLADDHIWGYGGPGWYDCDYEVDVKSFIPQALEIADRKEKVTPGMKIESADGNLCINCPEDIMKRCRGAIPSRGWIGFPDVYFKEAMMRGIVGKVNEL
ncbi:MAG: hypothetical protein LBK26_00805 [Rickettsiales bacterium]|nr:hypothetical protein [Rickettsiales bacterium]